MHDLDLDGQNEPSKGLILIVDDNHDNLRFLAGILFEQGYAVRTVSNGSRALFAVQAELPDLILLDIMMPGMSGYEVCAQLKAKVESRDIPIIFISALHEVQEKVKGFTCGGVDYITKPFQIEEVVARVATHLTLRRLQQQLQENNAQLQQEIEERTRVQEELTRYKQHLEVLVDQRTMELQQRNDQLHEKHLELERSHAALQKAKDEADAAHRLADAANQAKSEFIANISHELRTPLNGVLGFAQVLQEDATLTPRQRRAIEMILQSGEQLLMIINDLIDLSTIEWNQLLLNPKEFYLQQFLKRLTRLFILRAEQQGITFEYSYDPAIPTKLYGDESRIRQILLNLLGNAFKFTSKGRVAFSVSLVPDAERKPGMQTLRFRVEDTGIGIPADQLEQIFAAFHQIGEKRLAQTKGIGLGLTVSQRLAWMMQTELCVHSTLGQGSVFWFDLEIPASTVTEPQKYLSEQAIIETITATQPSPLVPPPLSLLLELQELADLGDVITLRAQAHKLLNDSQECTAFAQTLVHLADTLQIRELQIFLRHYVKESSASSPSNPT